MPDGPYAPAQIRVLPSWLLGRAAARGHQLVAQALAGEDIRMMHHAALATVAEREPVSLDLQLHTIDTLSALAQLLRRVEHDRTCEIARVAKVPKDEAKAKIAAVMKD